MLKLSSPAISTASFTSQDWIMNSEDGCVLDTPTAGRNLTSSYEGMDDLVMSNGYPMSSSPHLQEFIKVNVVTRNVRYSRRKVTCTMEPDTLKMWIHV